MDILNIQWGELQWIGVLFLFIAVMLDVIESYKAKAEERERHGFFELQATWARHTAKWSFFVGAVVFVIAGTLANIHTPLPDLLTLIIRTSGTIAIQIVLGFYVILLLGLLAIFCYHSGIVIYGFLVDICKGFGSLFKWLIR